MYLHCITNLHVKQSGSAIISRRYLQMAATTNKRQELVAFYVRSAQTVDIVTSSFEIHAILRKVFLSCIGDEIAEMINVQDMSDHFSLRRNLGSWDGKDSNTSDSIAKFFQCYTEGEMSSYRSEDIPSVKRSTNRVTPESWVSERDSLESGR